MGTFNFYLIAWVPAIVSKEAPKSLLQLDTCAKLLRINALRIAETRFLGEWKSLPQAQAIFSD